jgi:hypothetical protein
MAIVSPIGSEAEVFVESEAEVFVGSEGEVFVESGKRGKGVRWSAGSGGAQGRRKGIDEMETIVSPVGEQRAVVNTGGAAGVPILADVSESRQRDPEMLAIQRIERALDHLSLRRRVAIMQFVMGRLPVGE